MHSLNYCLYCTDNLKTFSASAVPHPSPLKRLPSWLLLCALAKGYAFMNYGDIDHWSNKMHVRCWHWAAQKHQKHPGKVICLLYLAVLSFQRSLSFGGLEEKRYLGVADKSMDKADRPADPSEGSQGFGNWLHTRLKKCNINLKCGNRVTSVNFQKSFIARISVNARKREVLTLFLSFVEEHSLHLPCCCVQCKLFPWSYYIEKALSFVIPLCKPFLGFH